MEKPYFQDVKNLAKEGEKDLMAMLFLEMQKGRKVHQQSTSLLNIIKKWVSFWSWVTIASIILTCCIYLLKM